MSGYREGSRELRSLPEHWLATEEQLQKVEALAVQLGFEETGAMKSLSRTEYKFSEHELPDQMRRWQLAAEQASMATLADDTRNVVRDMRMNVAIQLGLLAFALRQGQLEYAEELLNALGDLVDRDMDQDKYLADALPYIEQALVFVQDLPRK